MIVVIFVLFVISVLLALYSLKLYKRQEKVDEKTKEQLKRGRVVFQEEKNSNLLL